MSNEKKTATERASEMMAMLMGDLPLLVIEYAKMQSKNYGFCGEVLFTSYAHYAQAIEGLQCEDDLYIIDHTGEKWFNENKENYKGTYREFLTANQKGN